MGFHHVDQADLKLLASSDPPASAFQSAGITGVSHHTQPLVFLESNYIINYMVYELISHLQESPRQAFWLMNSFPLPSNSGIQVPSML